MSQLVNDPFEGQASEPSGTQTFRVDNRVTAPDITVGPKHRH